MNEAAPPVRSKRRSNQVLHDQVIAAAGAEFEALGFAGATTAAIARRADVTEAQLFRMFPSKQALFRAAIFEPLNRHIATFTNTQSGAVGSATHAQLATDYTNELQDFLAQHHRMLLSLYVAAAHGLNNDIGLAEAAELQRYFDYGSSLMALRRPDVNPQDLQLAVRVAFATVLGATVFHDLLFPVGVAGAQQIRDAIAAFVVNGVGSDEG